MSRVIVKLFTLKGDISRTLFSLLLNSTAFMSFSGRFYFYPRKRIQVMKKVEKLILGKFLILEIKKKKNPHEAWTCKSAVKNRHSNPPPSSHCHLRLNFNFGLHAHNDIQWISPFLYKKSNVNDLIKFIGFFDIHIENVRECHLWTKHRKDSA